jgi:hypothetical protein
MSITKVPSHVINFAGGEDKVGLYKMFYDYWQHSRHLAGAKNAEFQKTRTTPDGKTVEISFSEKEDKLNAELRKEIMRIAGIPSTEGLPLEAWATHPTLRWASFAVVSALVDMILPETMIDTIGMYTDVRNIGWGDSAAFDIKPRDLFVVSKVGRAKRTTELHKQYEGQVTVTPEPRQLAVSTSLYRVLAGKESLSELVMKAVRSLETQMTYDVYGAFATAMDAISNTASTGLRVAGYSQAEFVRLSQTVSAWNGGAKAVAIGTQAALANILPADANYRYDLVDSEYVKLGFIRNFQQTDIIMLPQVADYATPFGLKLADNRIWFVSPSAQKLVKLVLEGSMLAYTDDVYKNANLMQNSNLVKSYGAAIATNAVAGTITLS